LKDRLDAAIEEYPDTVAVLVRRHGIYGTVFCHLADGSVGKYVGTMQVHYRVYRLSLFTCCRDEEIGLKSSSVEYLKK